MRMSSNRVLFSDVNLICPHEWDHPDIKMTQAYWEAYKKEKLNTREKT